MKIGIIGGGYVGIHTALKMALVNNNWVINVHDLDINKINNFNSGRSPIEDNFMREYLTNNFHKFNNVKYTKDNDYSEYDIIFIALSTNPKENESKLNTKLIFDFSKKIKEINKNVQIIIRSTINLEDADIIANMKLNYWPEFLSQGVDTLKNINQETNIFSTNNKTAEFSNFLEKVFFNKTLINVSTSESIYIKLIHNTLDAHLINLSNLFANIARENNINFENIKQPVEALLSKRPKIKNSGIGYGGSCYPKDSLSLSEMTNSEQNKKLIYALDYFNKEQSNIFLEYSDIIKDSKNIVLLGSSFKGGTNDITKTPTASIRKWLLQNKINYKIWEPNLPEVYLFKNEILSNNIANDIDNADLVIISSDWKEFNSLLDNYKNKIIDLKSFIKTPNNNLYKI